MKFCLWSLSNVAVVFLLALVSVAQSGDWATMQALAPGEQIKVGLQNGGTIHGKFQSASDTELVIAARAGQKPLSRENVSERFHQTQQPPQPACSDWRRHRRRSRAGNRRRD
jgi:hypothetical protein